MIVLLIYIYVYYYVKSTHDLVIPFVLLLLMDLIFYQWIGLSLLWLITVSYTILSRTMRNQMYILFLGYFSIIYLNIVLNYAFLGIPFKNISFFEFLVCSLVLFCAWSVISKQHSTTIY